MPTRSASKVERAYAFFTKAEKSKRRFTLHDICTGSGYTTKTVKGYISKKWHWFLHKDTQGYFCSGLHQYPKSQFIALHSQKWEPFVEQFVTKDEERMSPMHFFSSDRQSDKQPDQPYADLSQKITDLENLLAQTRADWSRSLDELRQEIKTHALQSDIVAISAMLEPVVNKITQPTSAPGEITEILAILRQQPAPLDQSRPVQDRIRLQAERVKKAIDELVQEHEIWLNEHKDKAQEKLHHTTIKIQDVQEMLEDAKRYMQLAVMGEHTDTQPEPTRQDA